MAALVGKWKFESADNLDGFMEKLGIPENMREMARSGKPEVELSQDGDQWSIKTCMGDKVKDVKFKLGVEFDNTTLTGDTVKSLINLNGDAMVEKYNWKGFDIQIERQVIGGKLVSTFTTGDVTAKIYFTKA
ncbi:hypothetical protein SNE40_002500 [Patella caerulea]|uniref:Uncharacterized protein n=1 Tax=Patella caerulea TaxID=87958 RepID=A0AAN8KBY6_PATCE